MLRLETAPLASGGGQLDQDKNIFESYPTLLKKSSVCIISLKCSRCEFDHPSITLNLESMENFLPVDHMKSITREIRNVGLWHKAGNRVTVTGPANNQASSLALKIKSETRLDQITNYFKVRT